MGTTERFKLLFEDDAAILQLDTGLRSQKPATPPAVDQAPALLEKTVNKVAQLTISTTDGKECAAAIQDSDVPSPHDGTFCPLVALSRFPYHHIRGDLMQKVAGKFFDKGRFWDREWDLYYIHAPHRLGGRPLLLAPSCQARKLFREINNTFTCSQSLSSGLVLNFNREGFPQPTFLGQSDNRNMKDRLEGTIPVKSNIGMKADEMNKEELMAFEKMMEHAISAKTKTKSKAKKQRLRIQRDMDTGGAIRRSQCYLGLRSDHLDLIEIKWDEQPVETPQPTYDKPVPYPFWTEPVFISLDVEVHERSHSQVTEIGISTLDTRSLVGVAPGSNGEQWQALIHSRHLRVQEYANHVNHLYIRGCPANFEFGTSEWVASVDISKAIQNCFEHPSFFDESDKKLRPLVLVGHNLESDIQFLELANVHILGESGSSQFADRIDTATSFQLLRGETEPRSLGAVIEELGMTGWNLHNAGNDARYTLQALVAMLVKHSIEGLTCPLKLEEAPQPTEAAGRDALTEEWRSLQLAPYTVVSRQWQAVVERHIWRKIVPGKRDSVKEFEALMANDISGRRAKYIRQILFDPAIRGETWEHRDEFVAEEGLKVNTHDEWRAFYQRKWLEPLEKLFKILCSWDESHPGIKLSLSSNAQEFYRYGPHLDFEEVLDDLDTLTIDEFFRLPGMFIPYLMMLTGDALDGFPQGKQSELYWPKLEELRVVDVPPFKTDGEWILDNDPSQPPTEDDLDSEWSYAERGFGPR
ncbi:hypothetical protein BDW74DRAFT_177266 [Aspergillus multicolor]|uniref:3'-5' exonuclease n=1 Tax=Aspergillus multicolor TaxID=41759 RepID=UPI003CCCB475